MTSLARSIDRTLCVRRHKSDRPALHTCHSSELPKRQRAWRDGPRRSGAIRKNGDNGARLAGLTSPTPP